MIIKGTEYVDQGWAIAHSHIAHFLLENVPMCGCTVHRSVKMCKCAIALLVTFKNVGMWDGTFCHFLKKTKKLRWQNCSLEMSKYAKRVQISQKLLFFAL